MTSKSLDSTLWEGGVTLETSSGLTLKLRPVSRDDTEAVARFFEHLAPDDMRFRFLSERRHLAPDQLSRLIDVDHRHSEHLLAFDASTAELVGSLMIVADEHMDVAEVAIAVCPDHQAMGIGWALLNHAARLARERGVRRLRSIESRANHKALEVERALGFSVSDYDDDPALLLVEAEL